MRLPRPVTLWGTLNPVWSQRVAAVLEPEFIAAAVRPVLGLLAVEG